MVLRQWLEKKNEEQNARPGAIRRLQRDEKKKKKRGKKKEKLAGCRWRENEPGRKQRNQVNEFLRNSAFVWLLFDRDAIPSFLLAAN